MQSLEEVKTCNMPKVVKGQKTYYQVSTVHKSLGYSPFFIFVDVKF